MRQACRRSPTRENRLVARGQRVGKTGPFRPLDNPPHNKSDNPFLPVLLKIVLTVDNERNQRKNDSVFSRKMRAGKKRTYFFDVRRTRGDDYYLTLTESTRRFEGDGGYERHKILLYKEDFNRFLEALEETIDYIKTELMPDYDYDEFARRHEEEEEYYDGEHREQRPPYRDQTERGRQEGLPSEDDMTW